MLRSHRLFVCLYIALTGSVALAQPAPTISGVSAATFQPGIAPNSLATIFGANLAISIASATTEPGGALPTDLNGTSVMINGEAAGLIYVSPSQINLLVPPDSPLGFVGVKVITPASKSSDHGVRAGVAGIARIVHDPLPPARSRRGS